VAVHTIRPNGYEEVLAEEASEGTTSASMSQDEDYQVGIGHSIKCSFTLKQ
jgi:hypothetical protein